MALLGQHDYPAAKDELKRAVQLNPKLPGAHALHGRALLALGEQAEAERAFLRELDVNVNDFEANLQLGNLRKAEQKFVTASTYLERATTIRPGDLTARKLLASLRLQTGQVAAAAVMLEAIVKEAPDLVEAHVQLATAYNRLGRRDDAQRERAIVDRLNAEAQAKQKGGGAWH
jgi:Tfp pilus assembly protein PilF